MKEIIEPVAAAVHNSWMAEKRMQGVDDKRSETGENLLVPYDQLSEDAKDLDRVLVRSVIGALLGLGYTLQRPTSPSAPVAAVVR